MGVGLLEITGYIQNKNMTQNEIFNDDPFPVPWFGSREIEIAAMLFASKA